jgi:ribose transport system permease protein
MTDTPKDILPDVALPPAETRRDPFALIVRFQSIIGLVLVIIGGIVFSPTRHGQILFLSPYNIANIIRAISETGIIALGMTFVIITAGIDLSVGAMLGLNSVLTTMLMTTANLGLIPTLLLVLLAGTAFGALQGLIAIKFGPRAVYRNTCGATDGARTGADSVRQCLH